MKKGIWKQVLCIMLSAVMLVTVSPFFMNTGKIVKAAENQGTNYSTDEDHPTVLEFERANSVTIDDSTKTNTYYTFSLEKDSNVYFEHTNLSRLELTGSGCYVSQTESGKKYTLTAGKYYLKAKAPMGKTYTLKVTKTPFNWGTLKVNWNPSNLTAPCNIPISVSLSGAEEGVHINQAGGLSFNDNEASGTISQRYAGYYTFAVQLTYSGFTNGIGSHIEEFEYAVKPAAPVLALANITTGTKGITAKDASGSSVCIQIYEGGKWVTKSSQNNYVGGLKPDTLYKVRLIAYENESGKPTLWSSPSREYSVYTATTKKPQIKSAKAYGFKKKYKKKYWVSGYWDRGRRMWISGHYAGGYTYTSYKLKVTLKNKVPGKGTQYVVINGQRCKVKGKTYVVNGTYKGKRKKKKITVKAYALKSNVYGGAGSVGSKKVTIK